MEEELNLFDFGTNDKGEYVNLVEEEKRLKDIDEKEFQEWLDSHDNPLVKIALDFMVSYDYAERYTYNELKEKLEWIAFQKVYHYGNTEKGLYVYTLFEGDCWAFIFENENHIMANLNYSYSRKEVEEYLSGKRAIQFNALSVRVYDLKGNKICEYGNKGEDIRYRCVINEWHMDKYGDNRMNSGKKIKDFYEVELFLPKLIKFFGDNC